MADAPEIQPEVAQQPIGPPISKGEKLYNNLSNIGFGEQQLGKKNEFLDALTNPIKANKIYSGLRMAGLGEQQLGTMKEFQTSFAPQPVSVSGVSTELPETQQQSYLTPVLPQNRDDVDAHSRAIDVANQQRDKGAIVPPIDKDNSISHRIGQALYLPALDKGFSDLVTKPLAGATDLIDRTIDGAYRKITGEETPKWLREGSFFKDLSNNADAFYNARDKPKNIASETAEGVIGTLPLMASMFTGQGEAATAPKVISGLTKLLATTGAANAYKDATDAKLPYMQSLGASAEGGAKGATEGLTLDAQMLTAGALGKGVVNKLAEKGLLKGGKVGEALIHALSTGTIFGGTSVGQDLLNGKDIDYHEAAKQFGTGLAFEMIPVAKSINDEIQGKKVNDKAVKVAAISNAASNLNGESALRTLMTTPIEQLQQVAELPGSHEDLYAKSIETGMKAYDEKDVPEKQALHADQLALKAQGDVKLIQSKLADNKDDFVELINSADGFTPEQKSDLTAKIELLSPNKPDEQTQSNTEIPAQSQADETVQAGETPKAVNEASGDNKTLEQKLDANPEFKSQRDFLKSKINNPESTDWEKKDAQRGLDNMIPFYEHMVYHYKEQLANSEDVDQREYFQDKLKTSQKNLNDLNDIINNHNETTKNSPDEDRYTELNEKQWKQGINGLSKDEIDEAISLHKKIRDKEKSISDKIGETNNFMVHDGDNGLKFIFKENNKQDLQQNNINVQVEKSNFNRIHITDIVKELRNKGYGKEIYNYLLDQYGHVSTSEYSSSNDAKRVWDSLKNSGKYFWAEVSDNGNDVQRIVSKTKFWINEFVHDKQNKYENDVEYGIPNEQSIEVNSPIKQTDNESTNEKGSDAEKSIPSEKIRQKENAVSTEEKVGKSDADKTASEITKADISKEIDNKTNDTTNNTTGTGDNGEPVKGTPKEVQPDTSKETEGEKATTKQSNLSDEKSKRLTELRKKFAGQFNDITRIPTLLGDKEFREYAGLVLEDTLGDFKAFSKRMIDEVGDKIKEHLPGLYKELGGKLSKEDEIHLDKEREQEQVKTYGTKNAITEELQQGLGLPAIEIPKDRSDAESLASWKNGKRTPMEIVEQLLDPNTDIYDKAITPNDEPIMREYIRQLGERTKELNKIKLHLQDKVDAGDKDAEYDVGSVGVQIDRHLDEYNNALNASKIAGNIWHKVGDERQKAIDDNGLILNAIERIRNIYGKDMPADVKKQLDDLQKKNDELSAKIERIVEEAKNNVANQTVDVAVKRRTILGTKKLSDAEFKGAVKDILGDLKKDWKKSFAKTYATAPGIPQFNAIAPHIAKLVRLYADRGISKLDDIITHIHNDIKDDLEGISKDDIRDLIAGKYSDNKPISELRKRVNELRTQARNQAKIEELERGIVAKTKAKGEASPEVKSLQKQVLELRKQVINDNPDLSAEQLRKEAATIQKKIDKGEYFKQPLVKRTWENNPEWIKSNKEKGDLNIKLKKLEKEAMDSKKSAYMRALDKVNRWGRRVIFFGNNAVYTHLASSAVVGSLVHRIPEFVVGKGINKIFPRLAEGAPIEGNLSLKTEAKFWRRIINIAQTAKNTKDIFMHGETDMSKERSQRPHENVIPGIDFFAAGGHQAIKDPIVEATALASDESYMDYYRSHGIDETHPLFLEAARQQSWNRAQYEIFQNTAKNATIIKAWFNQLEKKGIKNAMSEDKLDRLKGNAQYTGKSIYDFMVPINTAPTNMVERQMLALRLPDKLVKAWNENNNLKKGIDRLSAEEKDMLLLQIKKGTVSAFYWSLGAMLAGSAAGGLYTKFYSDKDRENGAGLDPASGFLTLGGMDVPKDWQHNYQFQALQNGATWQMIYDRYRNDKDESLVSSFAKAGFGTSEALAEKVPSVKAAFDLKEAGTTSYGEEKYIKNLKRRVGINKFQDLSKLAGYNLGDEDN